MDIKKMNQRLRTVDQMQKFFVVHSQSYQQSPVPISAKQRKDLQNTSISKNHIQYESSKDKLYKFDILQYMILLSKIKSAAILCHLIGLLWHTLAILESYYFDYTWLDQENVKNEEWAVRYIFSFYWAAKTIMLVGPSSSNYLEVIFTSLTLFATVGVFAFILGSVSQILEDLNKDRELYLKDQKIINKYMRNNNISKQLQSKIRNYLDYHYECNQQINLNREVTFLIKKLPEILQDDFNGEINIQRMDGFQKVFDSFSKKSQENIKHIIVEHYYLPQELLFKQNQKIQEATLFLVKSGKVNLFIENQKQENSIFDNNNSPNQNNQKIIKTIEQGEFIGLKAFITENTPEYSAQCQTFTRIYQLKLADLISAIKENKDDYEKYCQMKDDVLFQGYSKNLKNFMDCEICQRPEHTLMNCRQIFFRPDKLKKVSIDHFNYREEQVRNYVNIKRSKHKKTGYLIDQWAVEKSQQLLTINQETNQILEKLQQDIKSQRQDIRQNQFEYITYYLKNKNIPLDILEGNIDDIFLHQMQEQNQQLEKLQREQQHNNENEQSESNSFNSNNQFSQIYEIDEQISQQSSEQHNSDLHNKSKSNKLLQSKNDQNNIKQINTLGLENQNYNQGQQQFQDFQPQRYSSNIQNGSSQNTCNQPLQQQMNENMNNYNFAGLGNESEPYFNGSQINQETQKINFPSNLKQQASQQSLISVMQQMEQNLKRPILGI
ncbi:Cyclic nucleotide-binding protein [Pseudocohnilembus persalinus]|uniref:Cyclic nucleotide-binding protein n=1 Tax=Pseudocohnilembus persalinus TaxID=266149 RepID=A0A0V0R072_PSEPJ|nr:Cyclic nucleotide-binding protein [Pseudocohnilembus persalinus]|eukprot:KRX07916.1 Cyclic nucleotide-binding protein [Pseudocohnilembus persalinus]